VFGWRLYNKHFVEKSTLTADLRLNGIGAILDYAAESNVPTSNFSQPAWEYSYESEAACDRHVFNPSQM
jgi:hypothetical protein